jgi:hypothetical protein
MAWAATLQRHSWNLANASSVSRVSLSLHPRSATDIVLGHARDMKFVASMNSDLRHVEA